MASAYLSPIRQTVLAYIHEHPGCTVQDIRAHFGRSDTWVNYHCRFLSDTGYVSIKRRIVRHGRIHEYQSRT